MLRPQLLRLVRSVVVYGVGGVLNRSLNFLLLPVFTAYLSPGDYGILSILSVVALLVTPVFSLGFEAATGPAYFEGNQRERKEATIWTAFTLLTLSAALLAVLGVVFSRQISEMVFRTDGYGFLVRVSLFTVALSVISGPWGLYLRFEERAKVFVALAVITTLVSIGLSILMVAVLHRGVAGVVKAQLAAQGVNLLLSLVVAAPRLRFRFSLPLAREMLRLGIPLVPGFAFLFLIYHGNKYVLQWFAGLEAVGVYTIGFNLGLAAMGLAVSSFQSAWLPYFMSFSDNQDEAGIIFGRVLTYYVLGFGTLNALLFIVAKPVVMIMTQPAFREAYKVVGFSASSQFLFGVFIILLPAVYFAKDFKYVTAIQAAAAFLAVVFDLLLIPVFGLLGAAVALVLGTLFMVALQQIWNHAKKREYLNVHYEWGRISAFALIYAACLWLALWERDFHLSAEVVVSIVTIIALASGLYTILSVPERRIIVTALRRLRPSWARAAVKSEL